MKISAIHSLRAATKTDHDEVDRIFSRFNLSEVDEYGKFLEAHAMALLPIEALLGQMPQLPSWRTRGEALRSDLHCLRRTLPRPFTITPPADQPQALGMLYVVEGSRLGGAVLVTKVSPAMPRTFLNERHRPGEWRTLLEYIGAAGADEAWMPSTIAGAQLAFRAFKRAGKSVLEDRK